MKNLNDLVPGRIMFLKNDRAEAYNRKPAVEFVRLEPRPGYKVPFIVGIDSQGEQGAFKPSDFI